MGNENMAPSAEIIDFQAARESRREKAPSARRQRTRDELLKIQGNAWIQDQLLKKMEEWGWDKESLR